MRAISLASHHPFLPLPIPYSRNGASKWKYIDTTNGWFVRLWQATYWPYIYFPLTFPLKLLLSVNDKVHKNLFKTSNENYPHKHGEIIACDHSSERIVFKMYWGRQGNTLVYVHAWLHMLEQHHYYTQIHNQKTHRCGLRRRHTQNKNKDAASIQTAPARRSETAKGLDAKRLSFHNNYPYREKACCFQTVVVCMCFCVREREREKGGGGYSCNIHPHWAGPDLTSMLILL